MSSKVVAHDWVLLKLALTRNPNKVFINLSSFTSLAGYCTAASINWVASLLRIIDKGMGSNTCKPINELRDWHMGKGIHQIE